MTDSINSIIDLAIHHIKLNHNNETKDWKAWGCVLIKKLYDLKKLNSLDDIPKYIDRFYIYKKSEYEKYFNQIHSYSDEYHKNVYFIREFISTL